MAGLGRPGRRPRARLRRARRPSGPGNGGATTIAARRTVGYSSGAIPRTDLVDNSYPCGGHDIPLTLAEPGRECRHRRILSTIPHKIPPGGSVAAFKVVISDSPTPGPDVGETALSARG